MIDGQQSDEQYMRQLYIRFRQGIVDNDNSEFYDEDELLDIYDYAQDEGDEMVQLYVFLAGARLYPDSDFLDERKAFFLSGINDQSAQAMLERRGRRDSALWGVLRLVLSCYPDGNPEPELANLLSSGHKFSCEAVIRLIDTLHDLNRDDLIAESLHIIEEKAENPSLLYYEAAEALYNNETYVPWPAIWLKSSPGGNRSIPTTGYCCRRWNSPWIVSTRVLLPQIMLLPLILQTLMDRLVKGIAMVAAKDMNKDAIKILQGVLADCPDNAFASKALAEAYASGGKNEAAVEVYHNFMERDGANAYVILDIMKLHPSDAERHISLFDKYIGDNEQRMDRGCRTAFQ